jgi:hypothetical protein
MALGYSAATELAMRGFLTTPLAPQGELLSKMGRVVSVTTAVTLMMAMGGRNTNEKSKIMQRVDIDGGTLGSHAIVDGTIFVGNATKWA